MDKFKELGLSEKNLGALKKKGFEEPTEIQSLTIPLLLENEQDIIAQAQTGTGKTAAFALPLLEKITTPFKNVEAIILAPTRELVIQICEEINSLKADRNLQVEPIYGGQSISLQLRKLRQGVSIVVGTPGRIQDHIKRKSLKLEHIKFFILDEADEMLNMGFIEDIENILDYTPEEKRVLFFSATMPAPIKKLAEKYMGKYTHIKTKTKLTTNLTDQIYFEVLRKDKFEALCRIIDIESDFFGIVFCRTRGDVDEVVARLLARGYAADALHGEISQGQREKTLAKFRKQHITILVATDVAARGIDVNNLTHVINFSIPQNPEAYIHRIGRTGRAGNQGTAITFITPAEFRKLGFIKKVANADIRKEDVPNVTDIIKARKTKIENDLAEIIEQDSYTDHQKWATKLIKKFEDPHQLIGALLNLNFKNVLDSNSYQDITPLGKRNHGDEKIEEGITRLFIAKGKLDNMTKRKLVNFVIGTAGIPEHLINKIEIYDSYSFINVPFEEAEIILESFRNQDGKKSLVEKAKEKPKGGGNRDRRSGSSRGRRDGGRSRRRSSSSGSFPKRRRS